MSIKTTCPNCRITAEHADQLQGRQAACPFCGVAMIVGSPTAAAPPFAPQAQVNPWANQWAGQPAARTNNILPIVLIVVGAGVFMFLLVIGAVIAVAMASRSRDKVPVQPPVAARPARSAPPVRPLPPTQTTPDNQPAAQPVPVAEGEMVAELTDARTWTELGHRTFSVNYRMLNGRPGPASMLHWVVETADGQRATRRLMFHEIQESGTLAGRLIFERGNGPYTTYLEIGSPSPLRPGRRVSERLTMDESQPERRENPPFGLPVPPGSTTRTNPYTALLENTRKQLERVQQQKAGFEERMQKFGGNPPPNPYERTEQMLMQQIEKLEQSSQQWEQQHAAP